MQHVDWLKDWRVTDIDGDEVLVTAHDIYCLGSAGSFLLACRECGDEHFRRATDYFRHPEWFRCFNQQCKSGQLMPIRYDDLETFWKPLWAKVDGIAAEEYEKNGGTH